MIISCAIYISLICNKKKKFKNKVSIERNPFEMVGTVELNNASVKGQIKARHVKSSKSSTPSNDGILECEPNDKDKLNENFVRLIVKLEHSTEDNENEFENIENCQNPKFPFGIGNSLFPSLVEDSFFENTKEMQVTETNDVSASSHHLNADTNNLLKCQSKEIGSAWCLENNKKEFESYETLGKRETKMKPKCCILFKSIETKDPEDVKSCAISLRGKIETNSEEKLLHQNDFSSNGKIIESKLMYLDGPSPNCIDCGTHMDTIEMPKDSKVKRRKEKSIEKSYTIIEINSIFECPNNVVVSL